MTILEKLYNGEISPCETAIPDTEEYREKLRQKIKLRKNSKKRSLPIKRSCSISLQLSVSPLQKMSVNTLMPKVSDSVLI